MNMNELKSFQVVYQERSMNQAAKKLYITSQGLGRIIQNLEKELGVQHIPTMVIFKNGKPLDGRLVEVKTPSELKAFIDAGLAA